MATRPEKIRLGIFLALALVAFVGTLVALMGTELIESRPEYLIRFEQSVSGLDVGSPVKLRGVRVGTVESIRISPKNVEVVEVRISVDPKTPIKTDNVAVMNMQGITGLKFIELKGGTRDAKQLPPGSEIQTGQTVLDQLADDAMDITEKINRLLAQFLEITRPENRKILDSTLRNLDSTVEKVDEVMFHLNETIQTSNAMLEENRQPIHTTLVNVAKTAAHVNETLGKLDTSIDQANGLLSDAKIPETTAEIRETAAFARKTVKGLELDRAIDGVLVTLGSLQRLLDGVAQTVGQNQESIRLTIHNLRRASDSLRDLSRTFQEKPVIQVFGREPKERDLP